MQLNRTGAGRNRDRKDGEEADDVEDAEGKENEDDNKKTNTHKG